jgi:hypothetical protein
MTQNAESVRVGSVWDANFLRHMDDDYIALQVVSVEGDRVTLDDHWKVSTGGRLRRSDVRRTSMRVDRLLSRFTLREAAQIDGSGVSGD